LKERRRSHRYGRGKLRRLQPVASERNEIEPPGWGRKESQRKKGALSARLREQSTLGRRTAAINMKKKRSANKEKDSLRPRAKGKVDSIPKKKTKSAASSKR